MVRIDFEYAEKAIEKSIQNKQKLIEKWNNLEKEINPTSVKIYDNKMDYLGSFSESKIPYSTEEYGQLFCYPNNNAQVILYYDLKEPFHVKAIAVLVECDGTNSIYDVYNYEFCKETDEEAKMHVKALIETALKNETKK